MSLLEDYEKRKHLGDSLKNFPQEWRLGQRSDWSLCVSFELLFDNTVLPGQERPGAGLGGGGWDSEELGSICPAPLWATLG